MVFTLDYGDCATLTDEDLDTLSKGAWLGDNVISFYLEYLERHIFAEQLKREHGKVIFLGPATTQMIHLLSVEDGLTLGGLNLAAAKAVFLLVNNCEDPELAQGGSHWSLLLFNVEKDTFQHFDSAGGMNRKHAQIIASRIHQLTRGKKAKVSVEEVPSPRQANGYDCGLYALHFTQDLARQILCNQEPTLSPVSPQEITSTRKEIREILLRLEAAARSVTGN